MNEDFRKHLDLIQGVVNRLAGNSFSVKTWAVGLIAVLGGLAAKDADARMACALLFPAVCFWWLDAYYLHQERLFRKLYVKVVESDPKTKLYSLDPSPFASEVASLRKVAFSPTVRWLHIPILLFVIGLISYSFSGLSRRSTPSSSPAPSAVSKPPTQ